MERKFVITSIFITLGAITFLSGYLLMPSTDPQPTTYHRLSGIPQRRDNPQLFIAQGGSFLERFSNKVEIGAPESKISNTLPLSSRKFISFIQPFSDSKKIVAVATNGDIVEIDTANLVEKVLPT